MRSPEGRGPSFMNQSGKAFIALPISTPRSSPHSKSGSYCSSPMSLLAQLLVTATSTRLSPFLTKPVMSVLNGGYQSTATFFPFTDSSAMSFSSPRSISTCFPGVRSSSPRLTVLDYVAVPEKYFNLSSPHWLKSLRVNDFTVNGSSILGTKPTSHVSPAGLDSRRVVSYTGAFL